MQANLKSRLHDSELVMDYKQGIDLSTYYSSDGFRNQTPQTETYPNWPHLDLLWVLVKCD